MTAMLDAPEAEAPPREWTPELVEHHTANWSSSRRRRFLAGLRAEANRRRIVSAAQHPADLAQRCDPDYVRTPAVELVSRSVETLLNTRGRNLVVTAPPQELKSTLCAIWTPIRALQLHPDWRIMLLTYADELAEEHSVTARDLIERHGFGAVDPLTGEAMPDRLGFSLRRDRNSAGRWRINEGDGGFVAAGRAATITGRRADLIIIDDPFKNMEEAMSPTLRAKVLLWYQSVVRTRLAPGASVILIQTRWHEKDLAGYIIEAERALAPAERTWRYINIPAVAHTGVPDALRRPHGEAMISARGRTDTDWAQIRRDVGETVWFAMYMGVPSPPEGGLFQREWFDDHRIPDYPDPRDMLMTVVAIDPAETGENDEAGIVAASLLRSGRIAFIRDESGHMTSDRWAIAAVSLALEVGASEIVVEAYTAGETYCKVVRGEIRARLYGNAATGRKRVITPRTRARLAALEQRVRPWRKNGDAVVRSVWMRQAFETGKAGIVGTEEFADFETQALAWMPNKHQPDRVAAGVIAHDHLRDRAGAVAQVAPPQRTAIGTAPRPRAGDGWMTRKAG